MSTSESYRRRPITTDTESQGAGGAALSAVSDALRTVMPLRIQSRVERLGLLRSEPPSTLPIEGMMIDSVESAPKNESEIVHRLVRSFNDARAAQSRSPSSYQPGAQWKILLESQWRAYDSAIERDDIATVAALLRNFFRNEGLSGFWGGERMFEGFAESDGKTSLARANLMRRQFETWRALLPDTPVAELQAPHIGNPWGYLVGGALLYEPVCEYHYQAKYFERLLTETCDPVILEIGGGFGGLAYHLVKRVPRVKYVGFDLPQNTFLQGYYLSCAFPDRKVLLYDGSMTSLTRKRVAEHDIVLLPTFAMPLLEPGIADLVVNVRSLSEMPTETIAEYHRQIDRLGRLFFFHENIFKPRRDGLHGIPSTEFPKLHNFVLIAESESRWPRYKQESAYPCRENLFIHRSVLARPGA